MGGSKRKGLTIDAIFVTLCSFVVENYMSWEAGEGIGGMGRGGEGVNPSCNSSLEGTLTNPLTSYFTNTNH